MIDEGPRRPATNSECFTCLAVFFALLQPGDRVLSLDLAAGGRVISALLTPPGAGDEAQRTVARLCRSFPLGMRTHNGVAR